MPDDPRVSRLLDRAIQGAERGATLTTRLLAFARRQELKVEFVELQKLIPDMLDFLRHSVGPSIVIHAEISPEVCAIEVDANQLELALINLAVNARDAMPKGGALTIACHNEDSGKKAGLPPNPFVCISVTDTGEGMSEATLARAQEPFFTTKGVGKGTGLGLSMVQGFTAQSGGAMRIQSEPGKGTKVTLWLPRAKEGLKEPTPLVEVSQPTEAKSLRVLLVDDDILVSMGAADMLLDLGHTGYRSSVRDPRVENSGDGCAVRHRGDGLRNAGNEDEVAMVIAHEIGHQIANHVVTGQRNRAVGALIGAVLLGAAGAVASYRSPYAAEVTSTAMQSRRRHWRCDRANLLFEGAGARSRLSGCCNSLSIWA